MQFHLFVILVTVNIRERVKEREKAGHIADGFILL